MARARLQDDNGYEIPQDEPDHEAEPQQSAPVAPPAQFTPQPQPPQQQQSSQQQSSQVPSNLPAGIPADWAADFLRRNPGDQHRLASAYQPTSHRTSDSQGPGFNQATNQPTGLALPTITAAQQAGRTNFQYGNPGDQFDDPYTKALEDLIKQQLETLQKPQTNPALDKLLSFLDTQFQQRSTSPGYTNEEQALLRTQALEPIERDRAAAQRRSLERTAQRGMLPSSGLAELDSREADLAYDQIRGTTQRDLGINAITKRNQDLAQALTLGQLSGVTIPGYQRAEDQQRRNEALSLSSLLYQLPRNAMNDSLAVLNGTPAPGDLFQQALQMINAQESNRRYNQQRNDAFWESIGETLGGLFG